MNWFWMLYKARCIWITEHLDSVQFNTADKTRSQGPAVGIRQLFQCLNTGWSFDSFERIRCHYFFPEPRAPLEPALWALWDGRDLPPGIPILVLVKEALPGTPPDLMNPPKGDAFALRSAYAMKLDHLVEPPMFKVSDTHYAATWLLHPLAPKVEKPINIGRKMVNINE